MNKDKIIYFSDELNDEFSTTQIQPRKIDESYNYDGNKFLRAISHFFWYRIVFYPGSWIYLKLVYHHKIVNRKALKKEKKNSFFLYGNHTNDMADPYIPTFVVFPKSNYVIVHANNVSMPFLGRITPSLGAIPLPDNLAASRNFTNSIKDKVEHNHPVTIYPEAHIWPFYTKIRPFVNTSFRYPVQYDKAVYCFTNTYQKRKFSKTPKIVTYIDGPFYPDKNLNGKDQREDLRNRVYSAMVERSKMNNVELIKYIKKTDEEKND